MSTSLAHTDLAHPTTRTTPAFPALEWVAGRLDSFAGNVGTAVLTVPAPMAPPETLLRLSSVQNDIGVLWDPPGGPAMAGVGVAHRIDLRGRERFLDLKRQAARFWENVVSEAFTTSGSSPRLFGGFAFDVGAADEAPWTSFGDGCFTLPRLLYSCDADSTSGHLQLAVNGHELADPDAAGRFLGLLETALLELQVADPGTAPSHELHVQSPFDDTWTTQIEAIRAGIEAGHFEKVVAARRSLVEVSRAFDVTAVLGRLAEGLRASTRFAFQRPGVTFLGATPERLVTRRGEQIETEALAGSIALGQAAELLSSGKDQQEHRLVVDSIVRRLEPLCRELDVRSEPRVQELREVLHLHTPIRGCLAAPYHVLDLVELLHPTPAVGGVPTEIAMTWIAEHERAQRGWYAAPIGWFDAAGDGEFAVALRSSVLEGRRAHLYAGAGIVQDSDPDLEYQETELKLQALLGALGIRG